MLNWARDSDCIAGISTMYEPRGITPGYSYLAGRLPLITT
jgi:hypothetical protein